MGGIRIALAAAACSVSLVAGKLFEIEGMRHAIQKVMPSNFDGIIKSHIAHGVGFVWYYHKDAKVDADFLSEYNLLAEDLRGMVKITALDCDEFPKKCKDHGADDKNKSAPVVEVFPKLPQPSYKYAGKPEFQKLKNHVNKLIPSDKVTLFKDAAEFKKWVASDPSKPKVVVFSKNEITEQKKLPLIVKGLSVDSVFLNSMRFGYVPASATDIISVLGAKSKVKSPPVWMILKGTGPSGKESKKLWNIDDEKVPTTYRQLHDWINVHSESGMGDQVRTGAQTQASEAEYTAPERLREFHAKSAKELCFGQKALCAIYVSSGPIEDGAIDKVLSWQEKFESQNEREVKYNWMWTNVELQKELLATLEEGEKKAAAKEDRDVEALKLPTMIFVKPPKKKREEKLLAYTRLTNGVEVSDSAVADMVEKIAGGSASYTRADLPKFVTPPKPEPAKKTEL